MKKRCYNPSFPQYKNYGGRGIKVCDEWMNTERVHTSQSSNPSKGFLAFKKWALENGYSDELTIDRIDNNKGYSPGNCRWVTRKLQNRNKRNTIYLTAFGKTQSLGQWSEDTGLTVKAIEQRLKKSNFDAEKALTKKDFREKLISYKGKFQSLTSWCKELDVNLRTACGRLHKGWDLDRVFAKIGEGNDKRDSN